MPFNQWLDQMDQNGQEDTPEPLAITRMTGLVGTAVMESFDEEGMTVIPSADRTTTKKMTIKEKAFVCGWEMNGMKMDGWQEWQGVTHQTPRAKTD